MDLSLCLDPGRSWPDLLDLATAAEKAGVHALYVPDHFLPHRADDTVADGPMLECWTVLSAIAARTARVRIGSLVLGGTYRHPAVVANMAATLDHVSGGRAILGLGAAWQVNEHRAYGLELPAVPDRLDRFEESTHVTASLLRHPRTTFSGRFFRAEDAPCRPGPVQERLPILVGGGGERRTLRIAATYADAWHTWSEPEEFRRKNAVLDEHCATVGREPRELRRVTGAYVEEPADAAARVEAFHGSGADEFVLLDHRDRAAATTLDMVAACAP